MLHKTQCINKEIKEEIKKYFETTEIRNTTFQNLWHTTKAVLRGEFIVIQVYLKKQEISNKQPNFPSKGIRKRRIKKAQCQQKKGNNKDQSRNKLETKTDKKINETEVFFENRNKID